MPDTGGLYSALGWKRHNPPPARTLLGKELGLLGARQAIQSYMSRPVRKSTFDLNYELGLIGAKQAAPYISSTSEGGGGGEGGEIPPPPRRKKLKWKEFGYGVEGAPAQWKALAPTRLNEQTEWLATMNMMIPFLSPQDQVQIANLLAGEDPKHFGHLSGMTAGSPDLEQQEQMREQYGGRRKLLQALEALTRFRSAAGKSEESMGTGYKYLTDMISRMADFSGVGTPQSRMDYMNMVSQLEPLMQGGPESYQGVAQMLMQPTFTGGSPLGQMMGSQWMWGQPHKQLWG